MERGFYTALGTPFDKEGNFLPDSMTEQIERQIEAGVSGLLVMGSMGNEAYIKDSEYAKVARCSAQAAKGRVPVLVGVTDVSIGRVRDRMKAIADVEGIDGIVSTVPYYAVVNQDQIFNFYTGIAENSKWDVYLYDLAVVTKSPTLPDTVKRLWKNPKIKGIKSGNLVTHRILMRAEDRPDDFVQMFSNIDEFDIAYKYGITKNLDGMFSCLPKTSGEMYRALEQGDMKVAGDKLDQILIFRDMFLGTGKLMWAYSYSMNLLGCPGNFAMDYDTDITEAQKEEIRAFMKGLGEI